MKSALLALALAATTMMTACDTGASGDRAAASQKPAPTSGVSVSGYARIGVSHSF